MVLNTWKVNIAHVNWRCPLIFLQKKQHGRARSTSARIDTDFDVSHCFAILADQYFGTVPEPSQRGAHV